MTTLSSIKAGDTLMADGGFTCMNAGPKTVRETADGELYVECQDGKHMLDGQIGDADVLIGLELTQEA